MLPTCAPHASHHTKQNTHLQWLPERYSMIYNDYDWNATIMCPEDMKVTLDFPECGAH